MNTSMNQKQKWALVSAKHATIYEAWVGMRQRCRNERSYSYRWYGAKGIVVDADWNTFKCFFDDMAPTWKPGLTLERKDNNGPYSKSNCEWQGIVPQANNRSNNHELEFDGKTMTIAQWALKTRLSGRLIQDRVSKLKWSVDAALTVPALDNRTRHVYVSRR